MKWRQASKSDEEEEMTVFLMRCHFALDNLPHHSRSPLILAASSWGRHYSWSWLHPIGRSRAPKSSDGRRSPQDQEPPEYDSHNLAALGWSLSGKMCATTLLSADISFLSLVYSVLSQWCLHKCPSGTRETERERGNSSCQQSVRLGTCHLTEQSSGQLQYCPGYSCNQGWWDCPQALSPRITSCPWRGQGERVLQ